MAIEFHDKNIYVQKYTDLMGFGLEDKTKQNAGEFTYFPIPGLTFVRIDGIYRSWDLDNEKQILTQAPSLTEPGQLPKNKYLMEETLTALHAQSAYLAFLIVGNNKGISYYMGASYPPQVMAIFEDMAKIDGYTLDEESIRKFNFNNLTANLDSIYNGLIFHPTPFTASEIQNTIEPLLNYSSLVSGMPGIEYTLGEVFESEQIERIAAAMQGKEFGIMVLAAAIPKKNLIEEEQNELVLLQKALESEDVEKKARAKFYVEQADLYLKQIQLGNRIGAFQTSYYMFANTKATLELLQRTVNSIYNDETSRPNALKSICDKNLATLIYNFALPTNTRNSPSSNLLLGYEYLTPLNSRYLSAFIHLPKQEISGFKVKRYAEFSLAEIKPKNPNRSIAIGNILDKGKNTGNLYYIDVDALQKHTIICGVTGGGKTNTSFYLLGQLWHYKIPFMVIEPAKSEYRHMMLMSETFKGVGQAFSLGDETVSPFRLNPFEIMKGVKVQTHLDALKSVFNASFEMYSPMPQVLEKSLNAIYTVRGWDLVKNTNKRLPPGVEIGDPDCPSEIYPTMKDLFEIIDPITESFGYSERIGPDVQAALKGRIGSLLIGGKGQMLNTRRSIPPELLFGRPTVIELKMVSEDSEKSFLMGMLLVFLYEYRESLGPHDNLQHIMLVEEAHRLLKNVPTGQASESANPAGKAVEFFTNMLAEIRSYGQGFIIADQIPNKLATEALKNTNLKIMHRIVANDDRESMGGAMNLDKIQLRHVTALGQGEAAVYAEKMEVPYHLAVMFDKTKEVPPPDSPEESDQIVRDAMKELDILNKFDKFMGCATCPTRNVSDIFTDALMVADDAYFRQQFNFYIIASFHNFYFFQNGMEELKLLVQRIIGDRYLDYRVEGLIWCALTQATARFFERKGEEYVWYYNLVHNEQAKFLDLLKLILYPTENSMALESQQLEWKKTYKQVHNRNEGPFTACSNCKSKCMYHFEIEETLRDEKIMADFDSSYENSESPPEVNMANISIILTKMIMNVFGYDDVNPPPNGVTVMSERDLSYCISVHYIMKKKMAADAQLKLLNKVSATIDSFLS